MSSFGALIPDKILADTLGDDVLYQSKNGLLSIKAMVSDDINAIYAVESHTSAKRKQLDVALADAPGLKVGSKFTISGVKMTVDDIVANDGFWATCILS